MSRNVESASVEFKYDATFYFDQLPNNQPKEASGEPAVAVAATAEAGQAAPQWYRAGKAPVPFQEHVFWAVMQRWILEAPSIIPPVSKVEIIQDTHNDSTAIKDKDSQEVETQQREGALSGLSGKESYAETILEGRQADRTILRRLLPKRIKKDPEMEELLYFSHAQGQGEEEEHTGEAKQESAQGKDDISQVTFAPVFKASEPEGQTEGMSEIKRMEKMLPFFYPKVRGFRYGYMADKDSEEEEQGDEIDGVAGSKRAGWITLDLFLAGDEGEFTDKMQYAFKELFKKLYKWGVNTTKGFTSSRVKHDVLVPKELYERTYARIKEKYAQKWVETWPERTDALKFVFEDLGIAAWLVALWQLERERSGMTGLQRFVDLGCGNGFLTHVLNEEGHPGTGIDLAARKVWELYGENTKLEAKTIIPDETVFEDVDWIIGNHADELAPWIPIIASRSKPFTRFVVIPCCFYGLSGSRYSFPKGSPDGKYKAYQDYIRDVIDICDYEVQTEILRIPSTKNVALVGSERKRRQRRESNSVKVGLENEKRQRLDGAPEVIEKEEEDASAVEKRRKKRIEKLIDDSGLFVARISDKNKQELLKAKKAAALARPNK
ncbi:tRNASer (uridine44-2'-O)-methyltransferase [Entomortierella parvispora]|uniref:tRNA (uracil-O(2)-)-methyltransferase n=1 Tax=Entomortierella parvispora TaxID=205924 RepID=A0A9P3H6H4_9FUNG|nr:tRNASer (uridine44-2'-O)-methyltransferase [Entomortierella parvispora]